MQIENHKEEVPLQHYLELFRQMDAEEAARRCGVRFENGRFSVRLLGVEYRISWPEYAIEAEDAHAFGLQMLPCQTFLLRFLLQGRAAEPFREYKTFREMPWGELYIGPYTGRCLTRAAFSFGTKLERFAAACERMGASRLAQADAGYEFELLDGYRMQLMIYEGDDEFPPSSQILYSANFAEAFAAEDRVVAGDLLITAVKANMNGSSTESK